MVVDMFFVFMLCVARGEHGLILLPLLRDTHMDFIAVDVLLCFDVYGVALCENFAFHQARCDIEQA